MARDIYLAAFVGTNDRNLSATERPAARDRSMSDRAAHWRLLSGSDSILVAPVLRFSERRALPHARFRVALPTTVSPAELWFGFRITGRAIVDRMRVDTPTASAPRERTRPILVFVCSEHTLDGKLDSARATTMRHAYSAAC
jgi:hypothetical protein